MGFFSKILYDPDFTRKLPIKKFIAVFLGFGLIGALAAFHFVFQRGPHMIDQAKITAFEAAMPQPPEGALSFEAYPDIFSAATASRLTNPLPVTEENIARGRTYYKYYCQFCHGANGDGWAPVGESYVPVPANLSSPEVRKMSAGEIYRAMLTGTGHEPALQYIIPQEYRWHLALYTGYLSQKYSTTGDSCETILSENNSNSR